VRLRLKSSWWTIVGVVWRHPPDSPASPWRRPCYVPVAQHSFRAATCSRGATGLDAAPWPPPLNPCSNATIRRSLSARPPCAKPLENRSRAQRFRTVLFGGFAAVAIQLAAVGMYGVTAYTVAQRRFEFALRLALGAKRSQVVTMTLAHGIAVASLGIAVGVALSLGLLRVVGTVLGKLPVFDPGFLCHRHPRCACYRHHRSGHPQPSRLAG